jgi:uncharacterized protein
VRVTRILRRARPYFLFPAVLLVGLQLTGCGTLAISERLDARLASGEYAAGLADIEKAQSQYHGANSLLYYFDKGSLEQRAGDYATSNQDLEQAERLIEEITPTSVSEAAASFLVNDMTLSYSGEDFEQVMVNVMKALNYFYLGDLGGAQVEARKVNTRLLALSDKYGREAVYKDDAFARYLSAFAYEAAGEYNDAYIDYQKAFKDFQWYEKHFENPMPAFLPADLLRLARWLGFKEDYQAWREQFGSEMAEPPRRPVKQSEVLVVIYDGLMLHKKTKYVQAPIETPDNKPYVLKVAFPTFKPGHPALDGAGLLLPGSATPLPAFDLEPLAAIAVQNLEQRIGLISLKAIARATAKYIAAYQVQKAAGNNPLVNLATNIYTWATEQADTRSWRTLPFRFWAVRAPVPAGRQELTLVLHTFGGGERTVTLSVELKEGEKKVIPVYIPK